MSQTIQSVRDGKPDFSIVDDDPNQKVHVIKLTMYDGEIGNLYIETDDDELREAIEEFDGANHDRERLSYYSSEDIALRVRDRLRTLAVRNQILELAKKKKELVPLIEEIRRLEGSVDLNDFPMLGLDRKKQDAERQLSELEAEFSKIVARE
jgi:hypothetical protein